MKIGRITYTTRVDGVFRMRVTAEYLSDNRRKQISFDSSTWTLNLQGLVESVLMALEMNKPLSKSLSNVIV